MEDNKLTVTIKDNKYSVEFEKPTNILDVLTTLFSVQLHALKETLPPITDVNYKAIKEDLFDKYNAGASNLLSMFAPEFDTHPDLTAQAMLDAENKYINKLANQGEGKLVKLNIGADKARRSKK